MKFRSVEISDWHRGTRDEYGCLKLSSLDLLVLTTGLPYEDSWFKQAFQRDYEQVQADAEAAPRIEARKRLLSGLYRAVPDHLKPREAVS